MIATEDSHIFHFVESLYSESSRKLIMLVYSPKRNEFSKEREVWGRREYGRQEMKENERLFN